MGTRQILGERSSMHIRTNRLGLLAIHATAPVVNGTVSDTDLHFTVRIDQVDTGNPLLDPELHALIHELTSGELTFTGRRDGEVYSGQAQAGNIVVPLALSAADGAGMLQVEGNSSFSDVHVPLPGLGHIRHLEVDIDGRLHLA